MEVDANVGVGGNETPTWFRFLLDENLLENHLKNSSDVSEAATLISTFLHQAESSTGILRDIRFSENLYGETEVPENSENNRIRCLKLLAIKTASYILWNLDYFHKHLPVNHTHTLLTHLIKLTSSEDLFETPASDLNVETLSPASLFALNLYHCWSLKYIVEEGMPSKPSRVPHVQIPGIFDPCLNSPATRESVIKMLQEKEEESVGVLQKIVTIQTLVSHMPVMRCFSLRTEGVGSGVCNWSLCQEITTAELIGQASYSAGCLFFFKKKYQLALSAFGKCDVYLSQVSTPVFMKVNKSKLDGYLKACRGILKVSINVPSSIHEKIQESINTNLQGVMIPLMEDIEKQELSLGLRFEFEDWSISSQRNYQNLYVDVFVCNTIRRILDGKLSAFQFVKNVIIFTNTIEVLAKVCRDVCLFKIPKHQRVYFKEFLIHLAMSLPISTNIKEMVLSVPFRHLFTEDELQVVTTTYPSSMSSIVTKLPFFLLESRSEATRIVNLEQELLTCYEASRINEILFTLVGVVAKYNLLFLSDKWHLPVELHLALESISMSNCLMSTLFNTLIAKARICLQLELYSQGKELLEYVEQNVRDVTLHKLQKLLKWEMLTMDLSTVFSTRVNKVSTYAHSSKDLVDRSKHCLSSLNLEPDFQPSSESVKLALLHLLNTEEWEFIISVSSNNEIVQFGQMVGGLCKELTHSKTARIPARTFIEFVAHTFSTTSKRSLPGVVSKDLFLNFVSMITNEVVLSVLLSCFTKLLRFADQNISGDIFSDNVVFWPTAINNTMLDRGVILEAVHCVLNRAMTINNQNISWIRTQADLSFALKQYHLALQYYLYLGVVGTDYFSEPITRNTYDDQVYRKMIQACIHINCFTQAAVMCQFLDEVDYSTAFKCLQEKPVVDSMDFYYVCIWDVSILEFIINVHQKNAEIDKMNYTIHLMKQPEMNSNNRPDILAEVYKAKKKKFLRRMAKQYLGALKLP